MSAVSGTSHSFLSIASEMQINIPPLYFSIPITIWDFTLYPNISCCHILLIIMYLVTLHLTSLKIFPRAQQLDPQAEVSSYANQMLGYRNSRNCLIFFLNSQGVINLCRDNNNNNNKVSRFICTLTEILCHCDALYLGSREIFSREYFDHSSITCQ